MEREPPGSRVAELGLEVDAMRDSCNPPHLQIWAPGHSLTPYSASWPHRTPGQTSLEHVT